MQNTQANRVHKGNGRDTEEIFKGISADNYTIVIKQ